MEGFFALSQPHRKASHLIAPQDWERNAKAQKTRIEKLSDGNISVFRETLNDVIRNIFLAFYQKKDEKIKK